MTIIATVLTVATNQVRSIERRGGKLQNREIASATYTKPCGTGTSACSGIATLAEATFFCSNQGRCRVHRSREIGQRGAAVGGADGFCSEYSIAQQSGSALPEPAR